MTAARTPARAAVAAAPPARLWPGTATIARSTGSPTSATDGSAGSPQTSRALGLTANSSPSYPPATSAARTSWPTPPGCRPAPITATEAGASSGRERVVCGGAVPLADGRERGLVRQRRDPHPDDTRVAERPRRRRARGRR